MAGLVGVGLSAALVAQYLKLRANYDLCEVAEPRVLVGPRGDRIEMDTRFCRGLGGDPETIVVRYQPTPHSSRSLIFAYDLVVPEPGSPDPPWYPEVAWTGPYRIQISISRISQVQRQRTELAPMHFAYRIGQVDYP